MARVYPSAFLWVDLETDCLPDGNDFSKVNILETGAVVTDFDLVKFNGATSVAKLTKDVVDNFKRNPEVYEMHKSSGLIDDMKTSSNTLADLEEELVQLCKDCSFDKGEFILAGSGVAAFDHPLIKAKMPELASWLTYYTLDTGILRRSVHYLSHRRRFFEEEKESFKDGFKKHRAMDDILAHIREAEKYKDWLRSLPSLDD